MERLFNLIDSKIVIPCFNITKPDVSLTQTKDLDCFKLYVADTGLFVSMLFNSTNKIDENIYKKLLSDKLSLDEGYLYENAVAQAIFSKNRMPVFHTWNKPDSTHFYEVDFILNDGNKISPIEVKSSSIRQHESLDVFCEKYSSVIKERYIVSQKDTGKLGATILKPLYFISEIIDSMK